MYTDKVSGIGYHGKFIRRGNLNKQDRTYINKLLNSKHSDNNSCNQILKDFPFNVEVSSLYKTQNHKHTRLVLKTKVFPFFGFITINSKNQITGNVKKTKNFIEHFNSDISKN